MRDTPGKGLLRACGRLYLVAGNARRVRQGAASCSGTALSCRRECAPRLARCRPPNFTFCCFCSFRRREAVSAPREPQGEQRERRGPQRAAESRRGSGARDRSRGHGEWGARRRRGLAGGAGDALWRARWGAREKRAVAPGVLRRENLDFKRMVPLFRIPAKNPQMQKGPAIHRDCGPFYTVPLLKPPLQSCSPSPRGKSRGAGKNSR